MSCSVHILSLHVQLIMYLLSCLPAACKMLDILIMHQDLSLHLLLLQGFDHAWYNTQRCNVAAGLPAQSSGKQVQAIALGL